MNFTTITFDVADHIATITLNRPTRMNALSLPLLRELSQALALTAAPDSGARCLLITGAGKAFCSGADLNLVEDDGEPGDVADKLERFYHPMLRQLRDLPVPTVAAVNGVAAGGGMSLALSNDLVVAGRSAYFLQAFRNIGLVPDMGSTYLLPRLIGLPRARELALLGERLPAEKAEAWGLIHKCVADDQVLAEARALAARLATGPTIALARMRELLNRSSASDYDTQLSAEAKYQRECFKTHDFKEGVGAFLDKRKAVFKGR